MGKKKKKANKRMEELDNLLESGRVNDNEIDIEKALSIDEEHIDAEWLELPMLMNRYGKLLASAEVDMRDLEEKVKTKRSQLILEINNNPADFGLSKPTMQTVEASYRTDATYIKLKKDLNSATYECSTIRNVVFSLNTKKTALDNLTKIMMQEFYASRSMEQLDDTNDDVRKQIGKKLNTKKQKEK